MNLNRLVIFLFILFFSCKEQHLAGKDKPSIEKAKWYFYCYANNSIAYTQNALSTNPLECEIKTINTKQLGKDTVQVFFNLYKIDTINRYTLKPEDLVGITIIRDRLFLPIYHYSVYDFANDSLAFNFMNEQEFIFKKTLESIENGVSNWLRENKALIK